jgi:hypothetical protein
MKYVYTHVHVCVFVQVRPRAIMKFCFIFIDPCQSLQNGGMFK